MSHQRRRQITHDPVGRELGLLGHGPHHRLVVVGEIAAGGEHAGGIGREAILTDEAGRLRLRTLGHAGGALFVRCYERGERVHLAMLACADEDLVDEEVLELLD